MVVRTEAQWLDLFEKHQVSGLNASQFCRDENLCQRYFSKRKIQLGWSNKKQVKVVKKEPIADFIQVSVARGQASCSLECGELKLKFNQLPPSSWLGDLVKHLR